MAGQGGLKINNERSKFQPSEEPDEHTFKEQAQQMMEGMSERDMQLVSLSRQYLELIRSKTISNNHNPQLIEVEQRNRAQLIKIMSAINNDESYPEVDRGTQNILMLLMRAENLINFKVNDVLYENDQLKQQVKNLNTRLEALEKKNV